MNKIKSKLIAGGLLVSFLVYTSPVLTYAKDETVYTKVDTQGDSYKTIVSTQMEDGTHTQEETDKKLPITCKIKYTLNGKEISAEELAGKSGKVTIEITYTNHEKHIVNVNGVTTTLYTPFAVATGVVVDNETNKNIAVSNGKVMNDGTKTIVVGMAMPGMQESLGLSRINLPDNVKITMKTTNFELSNIFTIATLKLLEEDDKELLKEIDELYSKINTLQSSSNQIEKGANDLKKGTTTYYQKSQEFNQVMSQVQKGANSANTEYAKLNQGIASLNTNSGTLNSGAKQVSEGMTAMQSGLQTISTKLGQLEVGSQVLSTGAKQIEKGVTVAQNAAKEVTTKVLTAKATIQATIQANNQTISTLDPITDANMINALQISNVALQQSLDTLDSLAIDEPTSNLAILNGSLAQVKTGIEGNGTVQNPGLVVGSQTVSQGISQIKKDGVDALASQTTKLVTGSKQLYDGTKTLKQGTTVLENGSSQMQAGLSNLQSGTSQLLQANNQLTDGAKILQTGATTLANGIHTFNEEGIKPICNYINGDLRNLTNRAEKLLDLSNEYQSFINSEKEKNGEVKFIIMSDSIKKEKEGKEQNK
ncbi:MAG: hypothetical protein HFJ32_00095 [Clostridia bacterium]|nr:hypothetical protein [Clostridia bacterium]